MSNKPDSPIGSPLEVKVYNNLEKAIRAFRTLVQREKILSLYKERSRYEKPSDRKRRKKNEARRKMMELEERFKQQDLKPVSKGKSKEEES